MQTADGRNAEYARTVHPMATTVAFTCNFSLGLQTVTRMPPITIIAIVAVVCRRLDGYFGIVFFGMWGFNISRNCTFTGAR